MLSEACFLLRQDSAGSEAVLELLERGLLKIAFDLGDNAGRVREILARFADVPAALADACLVRMAELHSGSRILTLDSDFRIYRMHDRKVLPVIMPEG